MLGWIGRQFHGDYSMDEFAQWTSKPLATISNPLTILDERAGTMSVQTPTGGVRRVGEDSFFDAAGKLMRSEVEENLQIRANNSRTERFEFSGSNSTRKDIYLTGGGRITFTGLKIGKLLLGENAGDVVIRDCRIHSLSFNINAAPKSLTIESSEVGTFSLNDSCLETLVVRGGRILNFELPVPEQASPFVGSVSFEGVKIPRTLHGVPLSGTQPYRNMRAHLNELQNVIAASIFHTAEQAVDLEKDLSRWNKFFGYFYWAASDFGSSPGRAAGGLIVLSLLSVAVLWLADGAVVDGNCEKPVGWYASLCGESGWAGLARGFVMGFQPISFLGALLRTGSGYSLIAANLWVQAWLVFQGILSGVLLTLFILALRRRFKLGP